MFREKRRAQRVDIRFPVSVLLLDDKTGTVLAGPVEGVATNFSPMGIALALADIRLDRYHLFFTCQDHPSHIMQIGFTLPGESGTVVNIPSQPVWYDLDRDASENRVLLGLEFLLSPKNNNIKKLSQELFPGDRSPSSWWEKIF
ncbi:MAG: hypothetical protein JRF02_03540 [Deltaproteobacteria bacterium]|jgi:hypothetical protein|nr:hypothetical protein [Deltaproteobacteria bacterium]